MRRAPASVRFALRTGRPRMSRRDRDPHQRPRFEHGVADRGCPRPGLSGRNRAGRFEPAGGRAAWPSPRRPAYRPRCWITEPTEGDRAAHEAAIDDALRGSGIELVCLAGYMRLLTPFLVGRWAGRMLNIHPSLLPAFPGLHTHARALASGVKLHGCTVHLVTEAVDEGPILAQAAVPVLPGDTEADRSRRGCCARARAVSAGASAVAGGGDAAPVRPLPGLGFLPNPLPHRPVT